MIDAAMGIVSLEEGLRAFREGQATFGRALPERRTPYIIGDKAGYVSPMDRTVVEGRTAHREHMRKHGVIEAGDMKIGEHADIRPQGVGGVREDIQRSIQELNR